MQWQIRLYVLRLEYPFGHLTILSVINDNSRENDCEVSLSCSLNVSENKTHSESCESLWRLGNNTDYGPKMATEHSDTFIKQRQRNHRVIRERWHVQHRSERLSARWW
jgi:hypothetical protein